MSAQLISTLLRWCFRGGPLRLLAVHQVDQLDATARARLGPRFYEVFCASYGELSADTVLDEIVYKAGGYLALWVDPSGECVGFASAKVDELELDGRRQGVLRAGGYFLPGHRGGARARAFALFVALLYRFSHPLTPLLAGIETLNPVSYRLTVQMFAQAFPRRGMAIPRSMVWLANELAHARGLTLVNGRPFVVCYPDTATHARTLRSKQVAEDLDAAFYVSQNPDYRRGHILLVIVPLSFLNLLASTTTVSKRALRRLTARRAVLPPNPRNGASKCH